MGTSQTGRVRPAKLGDFDIGRLTLWHLGAGGDANIDFTAGQPGQQILPEAKASACSAITSVGSGASGWVSMAVTKMAAASLSVRVPCCRAGCAALSTDHFAAVARGCCRVQGMSVGAAGGEAFRLVTVYIDDHRLQHPSGAAIDSRYHSAGRGGIQHAFGLSCR